MIGGRFRISAAGAFTLWAALQIGASPAQAAPADPAVGKAAFAQCSVCHATTKGTAGIGPTLAGIYGRKPGSAAGFAYSPAMKAKGGVWNDATLDAYLTSPQKAIPGNRMPYAGQPDAAKRAGLIAYMKTLK